MTVSDFSGVDGAHSGVEVGDADADTPYVTLDDVAIYKHDLVISFDCTNQCQSYKAQNTIKLHIRFLFCNKLDSFHIGKLLTSVLNALTKHCKITKNIL